MKLIMESWKKFLTENPEQENQYENIIESFSITDKDGDKRTGVVVQFIRMRGNSEAANRKVHHNSDSKVYNSNNKTIKYEFVHAKTPGYISLGETPYQMELMIKQVENGKTIDKKVLSHTGIEPTPEMQQKYEEAKEGLVSLDAAQDKYDSFINESWKRHLAEQEQIKYNLFDFVRVEAYKLALQYFGKSPENQLKQTPITLYLKTQEGTDLSGKDYSSDETTVLNKKQTDKNKINLVYDAIRLMTDKVAYKEKSNNPIVKNLLQKAISLQKQGSKLNPEIVKRASQLEVNAPSVENDSVVDIRTNIKGNKETEDAKQAILQTLFYIATAPGIPKVNASALQNKSKKQQFKFQKLIKMKASKVS